MAQFRPIDVDVVGLQGGERRANFGAQQHRAGFLQRDLHLHGQALPCFRHRVEHADGRDLRLQQVLRRLDEQDVHAAFNQRQRLLFVGGHHLVETDVPERGQLGRRPHGACHKTRMVFSGKLPRRVFGQLHRGEIDFFGPIREVELAQHQARGAKGVGLDDVAAHARESRRGCRE